MDLSPALLQNALRKDLEEAFPNGLYTPGCPVELATDPSVAAALQLASSLCKKWTPKKGTRTLKHNAIRMFLDCNAKCSSWRPTLHPLFSRVLDEMRHLAFCHFADVEISWQAIHDRSKTGPGASVDSRGRNSPLEKLFLNRLSTTSYPLYKEYVKCVSVHPTFHAAEKLRCHRLGARALRVVAGSTLSTVRKNDDTDRTVCTEASLNMWFQLGLGGIFTDVLERQYGFDLAVQADRNKELARRGSKSGSIATIDSTSASDLIAWLLTQDIFPELVNAVISDLRSHSTKVDGKYVELHMVSSMGNGFTFPMMTYIFSLAIEALCKVLDEKHQRFDAPGTHFGVFGDDICVPVSLAEPLINLLSELGFIPNKVKSYIDGPFRESCGGDYFQGVNVRGVYLRAAETEAECFSAVNRLNLWSARHLVPLPRLVRLLLRKGWRRLAIPSDADLSTGVLTPEPVTKPISGLYVYTGLKPVVHTDTVYRYRKGVIVGFRRRYDNPFGLLLTTINGSLRSGCISRRQRDVLHVEEQYSVPFWNRAKDFDAHGVALCNWETLSRINLRW